MLVLDANILIRAALGSKVLLLLREYWNDVQFLVPEASYQEAREHLPAILSKRNIAVTPAIEILDLVASLIQIVEPETYSQYEAVAREQIGRRDEDDWPVLTTALAFGCPIWTEDMDFFSCGVATWTADRVELYSAAERNS